MVDIIDSVQLDEIPSAIVDLFELSVEDGTLYFYAGLIDGTDTVHFPSLDGLAVNEYIAIPIELTGVDVSSDGAQSRPTLTVANIVGAASSTGADTTLQDEYSALGELSNKYFIGRKLLRRRTLSEFLLTSGAPAPGSPPEEFPPTSFIVDRISAENKAVVSFELASPLDVEGVKIPNRIIVGKYCSWHYQGYYGPGAKGGCPMRLNSTLQMPNGVDTNIKTHYSFFDIYDNPCVIDSTSASTYSSGTSYSKDDLVLYASKKWRSNIDSNVGNTPVLGGSNWQVLVQFSDYNAGSSYSYVGPPIYTAIRHVHRLWTPKKDVPVGEAPPTIATHTSSYWKRVDVCGKTVNACKIRFQFLPINPAQGWPLSVASVELNTEKSLPFGGYPGTDKFR